MKRLAKAMSGMYQYAYFVVYSLGERHNSKYSNHSKSLAVLLCVHMVTYFVIFGAVLYPYFSLAEARIALLVITGVVFLSVIGGLYLYFIAAGHGDRAVEFFKQNSASSYLSLYRSMILVILSSVAVVAIFAPNIFRIF